MSASAATTIDGPINLGNATSFAVLAHTTVTNDVSPGTVVTGDLGVYPDTSVTGFPPGIVVLPSTIHATDSVAQLAQADLTTAYNVASSLTPQESNLTELGGMVLSPGVYSGGALQVTGDLTLNGGADSIWVFQASSTLTTASASRILLTGGATSCNVFWQVASSATLGTSSQFTGTIMALQSIAATTGASIDGRLLASTAAVTLDDNAITAPTGCADASGTTVTTTTPPPPSGGTGAAPTATTQAPTLASTGIDTTVPIGAATALLGGGLALMFVAAYRRRRMNRAAQAST